MTTVEDATEPKKPWRPRRLSHSSSSLYEQCPRKWHFKYMDDDFVSVASLPALRGNFIHSILEGLYSLPGPERTEETALEISEAEWVALQSDERYLELDLSAEEAQELQDFAWQMVLKFLTPSEVEPTPGRTQVVATELEVEATLAGVPFHGYIDRLDRDKDDKLVVVDYKIGKVPESRYMGPKLSQLFLYAAAVREQLKEAPGSVRLIFPIFDTIVEKPATGKNINPHVKKLANTWEALNWSIDTGNFPAKTSPLCAWCDFAAACPEGESEVKLRLREGRVRPDAPALALLGLSVE